MDKFIYPKNYVTRDAIRQKALHNNLLCTIIKTGEFNNEPWEDVMQKTVLILVEENNILLNKLVEVYQRAAPPMYIWNAEISEMPEDRTTITIFENIKERIKYLQTSESSGFETVQALCEEIGRLWEETNKLKAEIEKIKKEVWIDE